MAIEKLTIVEEYSPAPYPPEVVDIEIDFTVGESSLAGDELLIKYIKLRAKRMPKEPCQRNFLIHVPTVANWTANPYHNREDFKVLLFTMGRYIEGDRDIEWVKLDKPLGDCVSGVAEAFPEEPEVENYNAAKSKWEDRDKDLMVAQNPPPYNVKKP